VQSNFLLVPKGMLTKNQFYPLNK